MNEQKRIKISGKVQVLDFEPQQKQFTYKLRPGKIGVIQNTLPNGVIEQSRYYVWRSSKELCFQSQGFSYHSQILGPQVKNQNSANDSDLNSQFPGKIRKILVTPGTKVKSGDPLLLLEAMKMEFTIKAPVDGKVSQIHVIEGEQVLPGKRFLDMEETKE